MCGLVVVKFIGSYEGQLSTGLSEEEREGEVWTFCVLAGSKCYSRSEFLISRAHRQVVS
jgi:hypothetical protein